MWFFWATAEAWAGWYVHQVSDTALGWIPVNNVVAINNVFTWFAVEEVDPDAGGPARLENDPIVRIFDWTQWPGNPGNFRATSLITGLLNNDTYNDMQMAFHLPAMCYLDGHFYIDVRTSPDAQRDLVAPIGQPDDPPQLSTQELPNFMVSGTLPSPSIEAVATDAERGGHHTLACRTEDSGWLERLWTDKPLPNGTDNNVIGQVADQGTPTPNWSGTTSTTVFANTALVEDHGVEAFFSAGGVHKRLVVWHLQTASNDALRVQIDAWNPTTNTWALAAGPYSLTGVQNHRYNWPTVAIWESTLGTDYVRIAAEDTTTGTIVLWACDGTDLAADCGTNLVTDWTTNAVDAAPNDPPPFGRKDQDPVLTVSKYGGEWFLAAQRTGHPAGEFSNGDEVLFLSACGNASWGTTWDKDFWPAFGGTKANGVGVPTGGMARLAYRQLKGWSQMAVDEYYDRVKIGYIIDRENDPAITNYEAFTASKSIDSICEDAG